MSATLKWIGRGFGALGLAALAAIAAQPDLPLYVRAWFDNYPGPQALQVELDRQISSPINQQLIVTLRNPSHEDVIVTDAHWENDRVLLSAAMSAANASDDGGQLTPQGTYEATSICGPGVGDLPLAAPFRVGAKKTASFRLSIGKKSDIPRDCSLLISFVSNHGISKSVDVDLGHMIWPDKSRNTQP